jgi:hypothetical protein
LYAVFRDFKYAQKVSNELFDLDELDKTPGLRKKKPDVLSLVSKKIQIDSQLRLFDNHVWLIRLTTRIDQMRRDLNAIGGQWGVDI